MNNWLLLLGIPILFSCSSKEKGEPAEPFFPVKSYLQSQVASVDSAVYRIIKITSVGGKKDTSFVRREEFRTYAKDFLDMPDIAPEKWQDDYKETQVYDDAIQSAVLNYMPVDEDGEIRRQDVIIKPSDNGDQVQTIFIERLLEDDEDAFVRKLMTWEVARQRFKIVTVTKKEGKPESLETIEVVWSDRAPAE